jgi:hypothetical protein
VRAAARAQLSCWPLLRTGCRALPHLSHLPPPPLPPRSHLSYALTRTPAAAPHRRILRGSAGHTKKQLLASSVMVSTVRDAAPQLYAELGLTWRSATGRRSPLSLAIDVYSCEVWLWQRRALQPRPGRELEGLGGARLTIDDFRVLFDKGKAALRAAGEALRAGLHRNLWPLLPAADSVKLTPEEVNDKEEAVEVDSVITAEPSEEELEEPRAEDGEAG